MIKKDQMSSTSDRDNDKWYPGKYAGLKRSSTSTSPPLSPDDHPRNKDHSSTEDKDKWYPGKYMKRLSTSNSRPISAEVDQDSTRKHGSPVMVEKEEAPIFHIDENRKIGKVLVDINSFKYFSKETFTVSISIDGNIQMFNVNDVKDDSRREMISLPLYDISSNIVIQFLDQTNYLPFGRVILPTTRFLNTLKPKSPSHCWHQLYPPYKQNDSPDYYRTGLEGINSYAMTRPTTAIGFVKVCVCVDLRFPPYQCLWFEKFVAPSSSPSNEVTIKVSLCRYI